jgi:hypothetical protein
MKLPNGSAAIVDIDKLRDYCLNTVHPRGRHKARVFEMLLGLTNENAEELRRSLLAAATREDAVQTEIDEFGIRYTVDYTLRTEKGEATIRSSWMVRRGEDVPRLISCFVR